MPKSNIKRSDGRIQSRVYLGTVDGKKQYKYVYGKTQKEVNQKVAELKVTLGKGVNITVGKNKTFGHWAELWLNHIADGQTDEEYKRKQFRTNYFIEIFGNTDITEITAAEIETVFNNLRKENPATKNPSSKKTLLGYKGIIYNIFEYAVKSRVLTFNPTDNLALPKAPKSPERTALSSQQIETIRNTPHECQLPIMLMIYTGMREGEVFALNWSDIDFENKLIYVNKSYNSKSKKIKEPKTEAGVREIPLIKILEDYLLTIPKTDFLVTTHNGKIWSAGAFYKQHKNYCRELGFDFLPHECRHTFVTLMFEAKIDESLCESIIGHTDSKMTREIYQHLREEYKRKEYLKIISAIR